MIYKIIPVPKEQKSNFVDFSEQDLDILFSNTKTVYFDCETDMTRGNQFVIGGLYVPEQKCFIATRSPDSLKFIANKINQYNLTLVAHEAKFDCKIIYKTTKVLIQNIFCTALAERILTKDPKTKLGCSLAEVTARRLNKTINKTEQTTFKVDENISENQINYLIRDIVNLPKIKALQETEIKLYELQNVMDLENKLCKILSHTEVEGVYFDIENHKENIINWKKQTEIDHEECIKELVKLNVPIEQTIKIIKRGKKNTLEEVEKVIPININSSQQIIEIFNYLNIKPPMAEVEGEDIDEEDYEGIKETKEKPTVGKNAIQLYINENPNTIVEDFLNKLLQYRQSQKLVNTYGEKLLKRVINGKLYGEFTQCNTNTGRLSSKNPNLQNIPRLAEMRKSFIPPEGYKIYNMDIAGQEILIAGVYSKETLLLDAAKNDYDLHSYLATFAYRIITGDETLVVEKTKEPIKLGNISTIKSKLRDDSKPAIFSMFYGGGAKRTLNIYNKYIVAFHKGEDRFKIAEKVSKTLKAQVPTLFNWLLSNIPIYEKQGYIRTSKLGRIARFKQNAYGEILNAPIQGTGAEMMKLIIVSQNEFLRNLEKTKNLPDYYLGYLAMTIHDEVVWYIKEEYIKELQINLDQVAIKCIRYMLDVEDYGKVESKILSHWEK